MTREPDSCSRLTAVALVETYSDYVWRTVRRLGVRERDVDDIALHILYVAASKLDTIRPGSERSFLLHTALNDVQTYRRTCARQREEAFDSEPVDRGPSTDELLDMRRAREKLDVILDELSLDLRAVFVLHELEEQTIADIATTLDIPAGTAASRLRRARALFYERVARESLVERSVP
jgi:RNA polymerase sigma-70 factor (ECF subfamily)